MLRPNLNRRHFLANLAGFAAGSGVALHASWLNAAPASSEAAYAWKLRLSTSTIHFRSLSFEQACERIAALGFEAVDIWPSPFGCPHLDDIAQRLGASGLTETLTKHRLKLHAFSVYQVGLGKYAELLGRAGGGVAVRESRYGRPEKGITAEIKSLLESLKPDLELADKHQCHLAIENHSGAILNSLDSLRAFVELNAHPRLGVALAPLHLQKDGHSVPEAIGIVGKQLFFFYAWQLGEKFNELPGHGPTDFTPWLKALAAVPYSRYVNVFTHHNAPPDEMAPALKKSHDYLKQCEAARRAGGQ